MPTVNAITTQKMLVADVASKIFRGDIEAANRSTLITGPTNTADAMINSGFGLRPNVSQMLGNYAEDRENFNAEFDRTISSLRESSDRLKETAQQREDEQLATRRQAQQTEQARRESAERFADSARARLETNEQTRRARADQMAEQTLERLQDDLQEQTDDTERIAAAVRENQQEVEQAQQERREQVAEATRERLDAQREQIERFARPAAAEDANRLNQPAPAQMTATNNEQVTVARERNDQFADTTRRSVQTQREQTERFAQQYLVAENTIRRNQNEAVQNLTNTRDENANAALSNVRNLVDRFNDAVAYFNENRGLSARMNALAANFNNTENFAGSLNAVGISLNENGRLRVNEMQLTNALNENSAGVNELLGRNGLAGRLDRTVELATAQRENLFPTVTDYVNQERTAATESLYALQLNQTAAHAGPNMARFVNMFS